MQKLTSSAVLNERTEKIFKYVAAYNKMDVENMISNFSDGIIFINVMNGENTMELKGIEEFKKQALDALSYFSEREQSIEAITHTQSSTEIVINYRAIAAVDFPNGIKKGDEINLKGKSIFEFSEGGKISRLTDIS
ncbi:MULTISPECIES: nuclear transport factor 2 family protein [Sphingobacterium]|uniref:nuclear transport factor 2 family protein n=1 Tax=Sphingobacterium TaxID=28453 RepID=UPI0025807692|nr:MULTISPECIES: nuclear transport factor 2 family protein [Sphingobacterium]